MAYRLGTMFAQLGGYVGSVERIGPHWFAAGMNTTLRNPKEASAFALDRSLELKSRFDTLDRDIRESVRRFAGKTDLASMVQRYRFTGISFFDRLVVIPTWIGAYNKAIAAGMDEDQAVHEADSAVRESQGAGAAKDLAAIQRGSGPAGEMGKSLTMFYSSSSRTISGFWSWLGTPERLFAAAMGDGAGTGDARPVAGCRCSYPACAAVRARA